MYLSDRDLELAIRSGLLLVKPLPAEFDTTGIDLHLDTIEEAKVWDVERFEADQMALGHSPAVLDLADLDYKTLAGRYTLPIPRHDASAPGKVYRIGDLVILEPQAFCLWQTKEEVGTPEIDARLICFINGKSTRARTGLIIHLTAPTIHAGWQGKVTLEIANLGPFRLALKEGAAIAQIVVAAISSPPVKKKIARGIAVGQQAVTGH